jgi:hypothetical protein
MSNLAKVKLENLAPELSKMTVVARY